MKAQQAVEWYDYYWKSQPIYNQTIRNITTDEHGHKVGDWDRAGCFQRVAFADCVWREI